MLETQREQLYNQQMNMEQTSFAVQNMQDNIAQVRAMKAANKDLKGAFKSKELNIDNIERMNDDMADMMVRPLSIALLLCQGLVSCIVHLIIYSLLYRPQSVSLQTIYCCGEQMLTAAWQHASVMSEALPLWL